MSAFLVHVTMHSPSLKWQETDVDSLHLPHPIKRVQLGAITMLNLLRWPPSRAVIGTLQNHGEEQTNAEKHFHTFKTIIQMRPKAFF